MKNNALVSAGVALLVVVLGLVFFGGPSVQTVREVIERTGAIPGTSVDSNCFSIGGVSRCYYKQTFSTASSTYCVFPLPAGTSTLISFRARLDTGTTSATSLSLATSTVAFAPNRVGTTATTSSIAYQPVAGTQVPAFRIGTSTDTNVILTGGQYLTFFARGAGIADDTITSPAHTGVCTAIIEEY